MDPRFGHKPKELSDAPINTHGSKPGLKKRGNIYIYIYIVTSRREMVPRAMDPIPKNYRILKESLGNKVTSEQEI